MGIAFSSLAIIHKTTLQEVKNRDVSTLSETKIEQLLEQLENSDSTNLNENLALARQEALRIAAELDYVLSDRDLLDAVKIEIGKKANEFRSNSQAHIQKIKAAAASRY